jgi:hypothetical protein
VPLEADVPISVTCRRRYGANGAAPFFTSRLGEDLVGLARRDRGAA